MFQFSDAEVPSQYACVMGVTGTLRTLSNPEKKLLKEVYQIQKNTYMPSVYGKNQLEFLGNSIRGVIIESKEGYFKSIYEEIINRLEEKNNKYTRSVMVFFESTAKLKEFYNSKEIASIKGQVSILTEETLLSEKEAIIRQAATTGKITLMTKEFGRGTDFICYDNDLKTHGGPHVIATFVPEELSEETQIKGRTARQGDKGSFSMVLLDTSLEKFGILDKDIKEIKANGKLYETINEKRCAFFERQYPENMRYVDEIKLDHHASLKFLDALLSNNINEVKSFLLERNRAIEWSEGISMSNTICLMDATGSMTDLLQKAKNTVDKMFAQAHTILSDNKINIPFMIQFVVFRNYNSTADSILQASPWESQPDNLRSFLGTVGPEGGWGNEAIEIALMHAVKEAKNRTVTQIILIGDAPPNTKEEVRTKRQDTSMGFGEAYWRTTQYPEIFYTDQVDELAKMQIPVHAFHVDSRARASFEEISQKTGGVSESLDINSEAGAERLTRLVTERVLENIGGKERGAALVAAYRAKFVKGYIAPSATSQSSAVSGEAMITRRAPVAKLVPLTEGPNTSSLSSVFRTDSGNNKKPF